MKKIRLFCTKPWYYLIELPLILLLIICFKYNNDVKSVFKLYPLIIALILGIVFIFIYFLRFLKITYEEVRTQGWFSTHDSALIVKDKRLALTLFKHNRIRVELFGPATDLMYENDYKVSELNLFRARANGGVRTAKKILAYFDVSADDFENIFGKECFTAEYENVSLKSEIINENRTVSIKFKETL